MKKIFLALALMVVPATQAAPIVQMQLVEAVLPQPNFFRFNIDGALWNLLCDQFFPNVTSEPYIAFKIGLTDPELYTLTALGRLLPVNPTPQQLGQVLLTYQRIAILDLQAYANPAIAGDVTRANRFLVDGAGALTGGAQTLLNFVLGLSAADIATYDLSQFRVFVGVRPGDFAFILTQEQTGQQGVPEPASLVLISTALGGLALASWRKRRSN